MVGDRANANGVRFALDKRTGAFVYPFASPFSFRDQYAEYWLMCLVLLVRGMKALIRAGLWVVRWRAETQPQV